MGERLAQCARETLERSVALQSLPIDLYCLFTYSVVGGAKQLRLPPRHPESAIVLHEFIEQMERLLMMVLLVLFGGALASGLLAKLDWQAVLFCAIAILIIRPFTGWLALLGLPSSRIERAVIAFYGIRGVGSAYYLAYALNREPSADSDYLWSVVSFVIVSSVLLHGVTVTPVMSILDRRGRRRTA